MIEERIKYYCGPTSKKYHFDRESRVRLLIGPFGTGKTSSAGYDKLFIASKKVRPDLKGKIKYRCAIVRNTYPQLRDTTIKTFLDWFGMLGEYNKSEKTFNCVIEGREIEVIFRALDTEKDVRNLLSLELTDAWIDEAREINNTIFKGILGRLKRYPSKKTYEENSGDPFLWPCQLDLTTNYPSREHWLYRDFVQNPIEGYSIYEQTQIENLHNLPDLYYEDLEKDYADRPDLLKTLVRGEWGVTVRGKQVYPEFNRIIHVADEPLLPFVIDGAGRNRQIVRGWDNTGLSPACVLMYVNSLGQTFVFKEFCGADIGIVDFGEMVQQYCEEHFNSSHDGKPYNNYRDIGDPAGAFRDSMKGSPASYLKEHLGIGIQNGKQNFKVRRESVANRLNKLVSGEVALIVDPGCIRLIDGFEGGYAYPEIGGSGVFKPDPDKNEYSHIHDALQYPCTILYGRRDEGGYDQPEQDQGKGRSESGGY